MFHLNEIFSCEGSSTQGSLNRRSKRGNCPAKTNSGLSDIRRRFVLNILSTCSRSCSTLRKLCNVDTEYNRSSSRFSFTDLSLRTDSSASEAQKDNGPSAVDLFPIFSRGDKHESTIFPGIVTFRTINVSSIYT